MKLKWIKSLLVFSALSGLCLMTATTALAKKSDMKLSDDEIKSFIVANSALQQLQQQALPQIQATEAPEQKQQLMQLFNQQVLKIIEQTGLTMEKYNQMSQAITEDPKLQERAKKIVEELTKQMQQAAQK